MHIRKPKGYDRRITVDGCLYWYSRSRTGVSICSATNKGVHVVDYDSFMEVLNSVGDFSVYNQYSPAPIAAYIKVVLQGKSTEPPPNKEVRALKGMRKWFRSGAPNADRFKIVLDDGLTGYIYSRKMLATRPITWDAIVWIPSTDEVRHVILPDSE